MLNAGEILLTAREQEESGAIVSKLYPDYVPEDCVIGIIPQIYSAKKCRRTVCTVSVTDASGQEVEIPKIYVRYPLKNDRYAVGCDRYGKKYTYGFFLRPAPSDELGRISKVEIRWDMYSERNLGMFGSKKPFDVCVDTLVMRYGTRLRKCGDGCFYTLFSHAGMPGMCGNHLDESMYLAEYESFPIRVRTEGRLCHDGRKWSHQIDCYGRLGEEGCGAFSDSEILIFDEMKDIVPDIQTVREMLKETTCGSEAIHRMTFLEKGLAISPD